MDDEVSEDNGSVTATILADADSSYVTGADSDHTTRLLDNDPPIISVSAVSAEVTEGTDAQFRFTRIGNTGVATRVGLYAGGLPKIMTDATEATVLTSEDRTVHIYGAFVDYILEFAAGETEKTLSFTTEADNVNEGDGWLGITIVSRFGNPFGIGAGYAQVHVHDDDIPTVSFSQVTLPSGLATLEGDTWVGELEETQPISWVLNCTGNYDYATFNNTSRNHLSVQSQHLQLANHPGHYVASRQNTIGYNFLNHPIAGRCDGRTRNIPGGFRFVGPDGGTETFTLVPLDSEAPLIAEYEAAYREAKAAADAAGTLITQHDIIHPSQAKGPHPHLFSCNYEPRYCPQYRIGTPHTISLNLVNRDPTILIKAESPTVVEGQPARFIVERLWAQDLLNALGSLSETVVALRASQNGEYITDALPTAITFAQNETRKIIELTTVDDSAFAADGSVTIELLPDTTGADLNVQGKYTTSENWLGHTPEGGRSDRATVAITDNDNKPGVSIGPALGDEGDSGSSAWTFVVRLASATDEPVTVNYATSDGTATAGQDYTAVSNGSVTIAAGDTTAEFDVSVNGDEIDEDNEVFNVTISLPSGTTAAAITGGHNATALGLIVDDDPAVITVAPKADMVKEGEEAVFVLTRAGVIDNPLPIKVRLRAPGRVETLAVRFERGAATAELAVATEDNNLVDYPGVSDYTIELFGDGEPLDRDDRVFTPGTPATATVRVTDDEVLINVTVHAVEAVTSWRNDVAYTFKRDGDISQPLSFQFYYYLHQPGRRTEISGTALGTFQAGQNEVGTSHINFYDEGYDSTSVAANLPWTLTYLVFGDGGWNGLNRIYQGGDPNVATVSVKYDDYERALLLGAEAPLWVSVGQTVSIPVTVTNTGSVDSSSPISITSVHQSADRDLDGTNEPRMSCQLNEAIAAGQSAVCEVSFLVQEKDLNSGNYSRIELDVTASDGVTTSNTHRIYMRVMNGVSVGFTETGALAVTEPGFGEANSKAVLTVTRVGRSAEAVQVAYTLQPSSNDNRPYPPVEGVDYADNSATPGVITFGKGETEQTITIDILGDQIDEAKERFRVTLVPPEGVLVEEDKRTRIVVIEDATPPSGESYLPTASLLLVSADPTPENAGSVDFAIVLDRVWGEDARFEVELDAHDNLTATPAIAALGKTGDFEERLIHAAIPAGQTRFEFSLALYDDDVREEDETFQMLLSSSITKSYKLVGDDDTVLVTIADDDFVGPTGVELALTRNNDVFDSVAEDSSRRDVTVTVSFSDIRWPGDAADAPLRPADPRDVDTTVRVQFDPNSGATHAAGLDDFAPLEVEDDQGDFGEVESFDIVIPAGQTSGTATLRFRPVNDDVDEEDETVTLQGSEMVAGGSENSLPVRSASFTIIDDDARGITVSPSSALIGLPLVEGGEPGTYSLVPDSQPTDTVVITLAGNQGGFLRIVPDSITFTTSDWATPQTVSVMALDDGIAGGVPPTNFVTHQVSGGDYGSETVPNISAIVEDTTEAFVYLEGGQASESDGYVEFTVTVRPILRTTPVLVRYTTVDDTAIAGSDYTREVESDQIYKILTIPAGWTSGAIRIPITDDQVYESANETFTLHLTNHNNKATLDGGATSLTATGAITDDDPKPVLSVAGPAGAVSYVSETVKDPVTFTLTLTGQSAGDVTVDYATGEAGLVGLLTSRQGPAGATQDEDYTGISGTVTFTSGQTTKTVTVQVTDDDVSEETEFFGFKISKPQGADLRGQRSEVVADVGLVDDDARGVTIAPTSIGLDEPASGETAVVGSYTVNLKSRPTDTVTVTIGGGDPAVSLSGDTLTNNQLTFTTTTWNTAQTITVTPVKDDNAVGETVTLTHTLSGGDYAGIAADSVTINLTDSDTRNVVLSKPSLAVTEGDAAGMSYTVKLATQPSGSVSVSITGHSGTDLTLSSDTLTFTVNDWDDAQTVTVKAGQDDDAVNDAATLTHTASGGDYANLTADLPVTVTDNDTPAIVFSETRLAVTEGDAVGMSYTVALATQPTSSVSVSITGHAGTDLTLSSDTLTFTVNDWDDAQTVTVKAGHDDDTVNDTATLTHTASGGDYANVTRDLPVTVTDNDTPGVTIEPAALSVVAGRSNEYTVALATQPTGDVTVTISGHASTAVSLSGDTLSSDTLTFTVGNWSMAQTVTVSATQSAATGKVTLAHAVAGADYASVTADSVVVSVVAVAAQQPTIQVGVSSLTQTLTVPEGGSNSYTLVLSSRPTGDVSVSITGQASTDLSLSSDTLTFTTGDWDVGQTVTVSAAEDDDGVTDAVVTLTHTTSGGGYGSTTVPDVEVSITENDTADIVISKDNLTVGEGDAAGSSYTVKLATEPSSSVSVSITGHDGTDLSLSGPTLSSDTLTFTVDDWATAQTVTVKAGHDDDTVGDTATLTHTASGGDYTGITADLPVTVTDAGDPHVTVQFGANAYTVSEGSTTTITVTLSADPKRTVVIPFVEMLQGDTTSADYSVQPSVTFNSGETSQTFDFTAVQDDVDDDDESVKLAFGAMADTRVGAGTTSETTVSITDDDQASILLSEADIAVAEGDAAGTSYTVALATQPSDSVSVSITGHDGTDLSLSGTTLSSDTLTFTVDDWATAQTVTVKAGHDDDTVSDTATLTHTASGGDYANLTADLPVTVTDNDTPGVTIEPAALSVVAGRSNEYTVALATQPTGDVTVTISGHASTAVSLSGDTLSSDTLTFTVGNWSMAQTVTVSAAQSAATGKVTLAHAVAGADYASVTADSVVVSVVAVAAQQPTIQVGVSSLTQTLTVPEGGSNSYTLVLSSRPTGDVSVSITGQASTDLSLSSDTLTFTTGDWDVGQTVTVSAAEDDDGVTDAVVTLTHTTSGGGYGSTTVPDVEVSITENDTADIVISKDILTVGEGDAAGSSYTVKLATQPSDSVSVSITGHADTDLRLDKTTLTFIVNDWDTPQTVTVEAGQDDDTVNDIATLTHTASGADYVNLTKDLPVTVTDAGDPQVTVKFGADTYTVSEGNTATITVTLSADPKSTVIIPLEATGQNGATSDDYHVPSSVTINGGEMSKTFQFMAMADDASDDGESVMIGFGTNLPSRVTKGIPEETMVSIRQMNPQLGSGVTVQFEADAYTVSEGGTATITVTLSADPQSTVVIPITATNQGGATSADYVDVPASVTFNAGKTLTSFNFMATQDDVDENCECVLLTFGALPSGVTAGPTDEAKVSIIDNSTPNGPPTVPPGPFDLTAYGGDQALYVQWETPAAEEERAPVTSYLLRYRQVGTSSWRNVSRANVGLRLREEITGLTNRSAYEVQVAAVNRMGTGAWASVKGTPQAPYALPPGPEGDEALDVGRLGVNWLHPAANGSNVLKVQSCTGAEDFRVIWTGPQGNRSADEWAVHINTRGGAGEVSYSITPRGDYFEMNGTANFEGDGALSLSVRGRFGSAWGTWWSPPVSIYCHEPEAPADTCDLQVQQQAVENTLAEGEPRINGIPESGQTLSADTRGITDDDGLNDVVFQYRWLADESEIVGATVSTYTLTSDDEGRAITVRVDFTDDAGHEESVTSAPNVVTSAGLELRSATVDGAMLTLTYNEVLDNLVSVLQTAFAVNVNGDPRSVGGVGFGESNVLLFLSSAVEAGDTVTVGYTAPDDTGFIQDILGRKADSFTGQAVTNNTDLAPLTASAHDVPSSHNGQDAFIFELRLSDAPKPNFSYTTVRDHAFTITGGLVTYVRRLEPGKNLRWEIHVTPGSGVDVSIALKSTTNCSAEGAICTGDGRMLSGGPLLVVPGPNTPPLPNTPAIGLPTISGTAQVGETLTADTTGISDDNGLHNATFAYQWLAADAEIDSATASTYTLVADEEGKAIKVRVSFTDDAGNDEQLTSAGTAAVAAAPPLPNTPAIGLPTISGTAQVGETLTADTTGISDDDGLGNATFAYQWLAADAEIDSATASTYTLVADEEGKAIKVRVSFTDDAGNDEELTSAGTAAVAAAPPLPNTPAIGLPTISGTAQVGETLTADTTGISDDDGLGNATFAYQWLADDAEIDSATASTYTLVADDEGNAIKVRVSFTDDAGNDEELTSAGTAAVAAARPLPNTPAIGLPTISGTAQVGETLTADTTGISDDDGLHNATFAYQWLADDAEINGATASTYTLVADEEGKAIKVRVSFTDDAGNDEELTSAGTAAVAAAPPLPNTPAIGLPTISGTAQVGETFTADTTGISDDDGLGNATFAYQWLADDAEINEANASTYTLVATDVGNAIKVRVSFTDDDGNDEELTSAGTAAVAAASVPSTPLTASAHDVPSSHNGQDAFIFELRFSEDPKPDFSYTTVRDHAFTVTGGLVTYVRRLEPGKNVRWEITVTPGSGADVDIALNATTDCSAQGAICTENGREAVRWGRADRQRSRPVEERGKQAYMDKRVRQAHRPGPHRPR